MISMAILLSLLRGTRPYGQGQVEGVPPSLLPTETDKSIATPMAHPLLRKVRPGGHGEFPFFFVEGEGLRVRRFLFNPSGEEKKMAMAIPFPSP